MLTLQKITDDKAHADALARIDELWEVERGTPEGDELQALINLVVAYEKEMVDLGEPDPVFAIEFRLDQQGMYEDDLIPIMGSREKVAELLDGKRKITEGEAKAIHELLHMPMDVLLMISDTKKTQDSSNGLEPKSANQESTT